MAGTLTKAGRYQIVSELGRGSMGVVYQGFDPVIGRTVAIKTMLIEGLPAAEFEEYKARFQREAQAAGVLAHPNIVTVYDFGEDNGVLYLAMEFLEGKSLQELVEKQNILPVETIIPMYEQVCSALDLAHSHNIVHRDIKPANIMILDSGLVKVTDFGIAKMMSVGMTQAGQILGTPNYMSPEQVKGRMVDGRSDIFSLGVILYELVTGEKPFGGSNITTVIYKIINENPIPPRELDASIHPGLSYVISKSLAKSPDERYQTCGELAQDLRNYKSLGGAAAPGATVVIKVPPIMAPPAEPERAAPAATTTPAPPREVKPVERPIAPPAFAATKAQSQKSSAAVWVFLALLLAAVIGGGAYFYLHQVGGNNTANNPVNSAPAANPAATNPTAGTPAAGTTTPAGNPSANPAEAAGTPGSTAAPPTESQPANTAAAPAPTETKPAAKPEKESAQTEPSAPAAPKYGTLLVTSNAQGARITMDGKSDASWVTPYTFQDLPAGRYEITVSKAGLGQARRTVQIAAGRTLPVNLDLNSAPQRAVAPPNGAAQPAAEGTGPAEVLSKPSGREVFIDGTSYGPTPAEVTLKLGAHNVTVKCNGTDWVGPLVVREGKFPMLEVTCPEATPAGPNGTLDVKSIPLGATVLLDGTPRGTTPTQIQVSAGRHVLTLSLSGYAPVRKTINVPADETVPINETLNNQ